MRLRLLAASLCLAAAACASDGAPSILDVRGPGAAAAAGLWWLMFWLGTAVFIAVMLFLVYALFRRGSDAARPPSGVWESRWIWAGGIAAPIVIIVVLTVATTDSLMRYLLPNPAEVRVRVVGHVWWWEVEYPDYGFTTANEVHIPAGEVVELQLESDDILHAFWVPQVHGKMDMLPGKVNTLRIQADEPGTYLGTCAEYCGIQHANMRFHLVAHEPDDFEAWLERESQPAEPPADERAERGLEVFLGTTCVACHAIRGTEATATVGPDLTHLASRDTLAAGTIPNTRGHLAGWILDPQSAKPGNRMPPTSLTPDELHDLLHYLESLR